MQAFQPNLGVLTIATTIAVRLFFVAPLFAKKALPPVARISYSRLAKLFHRLATGYKAGLDLRSLIQKESTRGSPSSKIQLHRVYSALDEGESLTRAMASADGYFPDLAIAVVQAGETGGRLDEAFQRLAHHYQSLVDYRSRFLNSIAWPCFELIASVGVIALMILFLGWIGESMGGEPIDIFGLGLGTAGNLTLFLGTVLVIFGTLFVVVWGTLKGWFGTLPMRIARRIPLIGKTIEALALSRFAWTMSVAENAGMNPVQIGRLSLRSTENYYYLRLEDQVTRDLQDGRDFTRTLTDTDAFPEDFLMYVDTGETAGELAESMSRCSDALRQKAENNLNIIAKIGFFLVFLLVAVLIGGTVILLYMRYINQLQQFM